MVVSAGHLEPVDGEVPVAARPPASRLRRLSASQRRRQLLDVALRLFATRGYTATTMDDIAEAAGVTKPLLYQHFDSKRALYVELVHTVATTMRKAIEAATSEATSPRQQVEGGFRAYFDLVVSEAHAFRLLFGPTGPEDQETADMLRHVEDQMAEAVASLIDAGLDDDHRRLLAYAVVGMAEGASRYLLTHGLPDDASEAAPGVAAATDGTARGDGCLDGPAGADGRSAPTAAVTTRLASRLADLAWAGLRSVHRD
jgi:AcrR family transcriptional regulator